MKNVETKYKKLEYELYKMSYLQTWELQAHKLWKYCK